ncbi:MAG: HD domain-containing protein [Gemmatimonadales bacterium]
MGPPPGHRRNEEVVTPDEIPDHASRSDSPPWPTSATALPSLGAPAGAPSGTAVRAAFLVQDLETRLGDNPHTILTFSNAQGRLRSAPIWASDHHRIEQVTRGAAVEVAGVMSAWRNRPQLQLERLRLLSADEIAWDRLHPSIGDPAPWWALVDHWRGTVRPSLAQILARFFGTPSFRRRFGECPASLTTHHARIGGLLQHTCEVARLALTSAAMARGADRDLLLTGALLHDIGKVESYDWEGNFTTTLGGRVIGHVVLGSRLLDQAIAGEGSDQSEELVALHHLLLSHHGRLEYGAPIPPVSLEAEILSHADVTSARTSAFNEALANPEYFAPDDQFSRRGVWELDNRHLWRGSSDRR